MSDFDYYMTDVHSGVAVTDTGRFLTPCCAALATNGLDLHHAVCSMCQRKQSLILLQPTSQMNITNALYVYGCQSSPEVCAKQLHTVLNEDSL